MRTAKFYSGAQLERLRCQLHGLGNLVLSMPEPQTSDERRIASLATIARDSIQRAMQIVQEVREASR